MHNNNNNKKQTSNCYFKGDQKGKQPARQKTFAAEPRKVFAGTLPAGAVPA